MQPHRWSATTLAPLAAAVALVAAPAAARADKAIAAQITSGVDEQVTVIGRVLGGGLLSVGRFGFDGQLSFEGFLRLDGNQGVSARSFGIPNLGVRYGFGGDHFIGPYVAAGGGFHFISGKPRERKLDNDTETCAGFDMLSPGQCTFEIDKILDARLGFGWGFPSGKRTTVGVRLDVTYWLFSVSGDQERGSPPARDVARPQDSIAVMIGLEFLRWQ